MDDNWTLLENVWTLIVALLLGTWFLASIIHQFRFEWWLRIAHYDVFGFLPSWTFFAPNPGCHDFHLVYRDWNSDKSSSWSEIVVSPSLDLRWRWFWNPYRFPDKAVFDMVRSFRQTISFHADKEDSRVIMLSGVYIGLLQMVMAQPLIDADSEHRQFAILQTQDFASDRRIEVVFVSEKHRRAAA